MGAGMDKILPGLFVGSIRDSKDMEQIRKHGITHILSIHEDAREGTFKVSPVFIFIFIFREYSFFFLIILNSKRKLSIYASKRAITRPKT